MHDEPRAAVPASATAAPGRPLSRPLVLLMATATGLAVSCNYYMQPLLGTIAQDLDVGESAAGALVTTAQLAYALGLLLIVPLGDLWERRGLIVVLMLASAAGLLLTGSANSLALAIAGTALTGVSTVVAQVLVPMAAALSAPEARGRTMGTLMSGLIAGILLGRTFAGLLSAVGGWRTVYWVSAPLLIAMTALLWLRLPRQSAANAMRYPQLIASVFSLLRDDPVLRLRALLGALSFGAFTVLWAPLALLLSAPPFGYSDAVIGLFGLVGVVGVAAASLAGRLADRGRGRRATWIGLIGLPVAWLLLGAAPWSVVALVAGILIVDLAVQLVHVTNQAVIYRSHPEARSRIASGYMTSYFIGGAAGSALAIGLFHVAGWTGVTAVGLAFGLAAVLAGRRLARPPHA